VGSPSSTEECGRRNAFAPPLCIAGRPAEVIDEGFDRRQRLPGCQAISFRDVQAV
jgi:hypothetical protein